MGKIIGIDLGTTNSVVSVMEGGTATVISTAEGGRLLPSVVAFNKNSERLVGQTAKRQAVVNSENTVYSIKRFIGRRFEETDVERKMVSYEVVKGPADDVRVKIPITGREYSPQEISAMILSKLKTDAEAYLAGCTERCRVIDQKNDELKKLLAATNTVTPPIEKALAEAAQLRANCQKLMLQHFYEVSRTMPPEQGKRYLEWVQGQTILPESHRGMGAPMQSQAETHGH